MQRLAAITDPIRRRFADLDGWLEKLRSTWSCGLDALERELGAEDGAAGRAAKAKKKKPSS